MKKNSQNERLVPKLDPIMGEIKHALLKISCNCKASPFFSHPRRFRNGSKEAFSILKQIDAYKKLRKSAASKNSEAEVKNIMNILSNTKKLVNRVSKEANAAEYVSVNFFKKFSEISSKVRRLLV